jgi:hypothetical protein
MSEQTILQAFESMNAEIAKLVLSMDALKQSVQACSKPPAVRKPKAAKAAKAEAKPVLVVSELPDVPEVVESHVVGFPVTTVTFSALPAKVEKAKKPRAKKAPELVPKHEV